MTLYDALRGVAHGQAMRRPSWGADIVVELTPSDGEGRLTIRQADGPHPWTISASDLDAGDWLVLTKLAAVPRKPAFGHPVAAERVESAMRALENDAPVAGAMTPTPTPTPEPE